MKPLVTTVRALRELATGLSPQAVEASAILHEVDMQDATFLISADDDVNVQRIVLNRCDSERERYVPDALGGRRRDALSRMVNFAERARSRGALSLPRNWHQYKYKSFITFYAIHSGDEKSSRWIVESLPGERADVVFWLLTTSDNQVSLEEFEASTRTLPNWEDLWWSAHAESAEHFASLRASKKMADTEVDLADPVPVAISSLSYYQWIEAISDDQRSFLEARTDRSIRLRGPAGSGKTLAVALKAVQEALSARELGEDLRVVVVTHSWSLATQIAELIDTFGLGSFPEIDIFPLIEIAEAVSPQYVKDLSGVGLIGDDSYSSTRAQLDEIIELLSDFIQGDWITYRNAVGEGFRNRFEGGDLDQIRALAWDLLIEFGSVIGAAAIFPGAGSELRYLQLPRAGWMLPLESKDEARVVFRLYTLYLESLDARSLVTTDQVLADFLSYLETHAWNRLRRAQGYDLIFVDEFHLFSPLERQVLHYLSKDTAHYPRVFMATDPRQSPSESFIGVAADQIMSSLAQKPDDNLGSIADFELSIVHRFSPQILDLIKHVHHEFPTLELGKEWEIDFKSVESGQEDGHRPIIIRSGSRAAEEVDIVKAVQSLYPSGRMALAVVDSRQWPRFSELAARLASTGKYNVSVISGRTEIEGVGYRSRGIVVGPAEYLAGLQFDSVLVAGVPDMRAYAARGNERTRILSLLYLALSRARKQVKIFVNDDDGGAAEVLEHAAANGLLKSELGSPV